MAIIIMLNNYFHDLAVAMLFVNVLLSYFYIKVFASEVKKEKLSQFIGLSFYITIISLVLILLLGIPRAIFYMEYEWLPAAGRGQITALIIKHIILAGITLFGIIFQWRLKKVTHDK